MLHCVPYDILYHNSLHAVLYYPLAYSSASAPINAFNFVSEETGTSHLFS